MIILSALVVASVALWVLGPVLGWGATNAFPADDTKQNDLLARRQEALRDLKDLELEYAVGKLTLEDFERTKAELSRQAVEIYKEIDAQAPVHDAR